MVRISSLVKVFGSIRAVDNLNMDMKPGEITGLLGPNGAGKSTTIKCLAGLLVPDTGSMSVMGIDPSENPLGVRRVIGYVPENPVVFSALSGREFLDLSGSLYGLSRNVLNRRTQDLALQFSLADAIDHETGSYSRGMVQKLVIAAAIMHNPDVLIMDEPFSGLDASSTAILKEMLRAFAAKGKTVIFSSHVMEVVEKLCSRVHIIDSGKLKATGSAADIIRDTGASSFEEAFIMLTGNTDIGSNAAGIITSVTGDE